jgi:hypothetical protein
MPNYKKEIYTRAEADALLALVYEESIIQVFKVKQSSTNITF